MNILIIGNGFDLEHDLPTKYTDFLDFMEKFSKMSRFAIIPKNTTTDTPYTHYIYDLCTQDIYKDRYNALSIFTDDNCWIKYFRRLRKEHIRNQENWIDFEKEISTIIQTFESLINYYENQKREGIANKKFEEHCLGIIEKILPNTELQGTEQKNNITKLLEDLNKLIGALEIYIWDFIGEQIILYYNPSIDEIHADKVLSFNYSDTFRTLYASNRQDVEYCFIHGKAQNNISDAQECIDDERKKVFIKKNAETNNMVLGIEEYLPDDRSNKEIDFIAFKKYYQRIYKKTGNEYKEWLEEIDRKENKEKHTVYIFGHSLDVTDGDVLREFLYHDNVKFVIFYRNKEQLGQQIANLVQILSVNDVIKKVYGNNPCIEFREQLARKEIKGSEFEVRLDIGLLKMIYGNPIYDNTQFLEKIWDKINKNDMGYFHSQKNVISLFDVLQKMGKGMEYKSALLDIAKNLKRDDGGYQNLDNPIECDAATKKFINAINLSNLEVFTPGFNI